MRTIFIYELRAKRTSERRKKSEFSDPSQRVSNKNRINEPMFIIPETTARSAVPGVSPGARVTNSARLFTPG